MDILKMNVVIKNEAKVLPLHCPSTDVINSAVVRGSENEAVAFLKKHLCQVDAMDSCGRTALHVAASCGKLKVVKFLLVRGANLEKPDLESLYTPLHRALYYGQIKVAVYLIQRGSCPYSLDADGISPLGLESHNLPKTSDMESMLQDVQLYVWGSNSYYNIGQVKGNSVENPQRLDICHEDYNYVTGVVMNKYHSVFVTIKGTAYSCGIGRNFQLGSSQGLVAMPQRIQGLSVKKVALGEEHSIFLTEDNKVWACGSNRHRQLGVKSHQSCLALTEVLTGISARKRVLGIAAAKYHSCFWTESHLYTFGLNAGQLGHTKSSTEITVIEPKIVASVVTEDSKIETVATSNGAIVVAFVDGRVQCLHEYQTRAITTQKGNVVKVCCIGGTLDNNTVEEEHGGAKCVEGLQILILYADGSLYYWDDRNRRLFLTSFIGMKEVRVRDVCLYSGGFCIATASFEGYKGIFCPAVNEFSKSRRFKSVRCTIEAVLTKIPLLHRVISVRSDPDGSNFTAIQYNHRKNTKPVSVPGLSRLLERRKQLMEECAENDGLTDIVFLVKKNRFPAHSVIISQRSAILNDLIHVLSLKRVSSKKLPSNSIEIELCLDPILFKEILAYMYCGLCDLTLGKYNKYSFNYFNKPVFSGQSFSICIDMLQKYKSQIMTAGNSISAIGTALGLLLPLDKPFIVCDNDEISGEIERNFLTFCKEKCHYNSNDFLHDVQFSCNGAIVKAHKCILVSSCDYFVAMFSSANWLETTTRAPIKLPFKVNAFKLFLEYLYTDDVDVLSQATDYNLVCDLLVIAHQFLIWRLQQLCEISLFRFATLANCVELLRFADCFSAFILKENIFEFMTVNMAAILEMRLMEELTEEILEELSTFYISCTNKRRVIHIDDDFMYSQTKHRKCSRLLKLEDLVCDSLEPTILSSRFIKPFTRLPLHEQLAKVLRENDSVRNETEQDWIRELVTGNRKPKDVTPALRRRRKPSSKQQPSRRSRTSSSSSSYSADSDHDSQQQEEEFSFRGLSERNTSSDTAEWKTITTRKKKSLPVPNPEEQSHLLQNKAPDPTNEIEEKENRPDTKPVIIQLPKKLPQTPPPSIQDSVLFPSITQASGKKKSSSTRMPRKSFKSRRKISPEEVLSDVTEDAGGWL